jgi:hypothetical protein
MAEICYPFTDSPAATELQWQRMARLWMPDGIDSPANGNAGKVTAGSGLTVNVAPCNAILRGFYYSLDATKNIGLAINNASTARIDKIVIRIDCNANTATAIAIQGTAAATPVAPTMSYTETVFDLPLADVRVEANDTISTITDRRRFVGRPIVYCTSANRPDPQGRPLLAFEQDTSRVVYTSGDGNWVVGMGADVFRPKYVRSEDAGLSSAFSYWSATLTDTVDASLSLSFTAPPSGQAFITIGALLANDTAGRYTFMGMRLRDSTGTDYWALPGDPDGGNRVLRHMGGVAGSSSHCSTTLWAGSLVPGRVYTASLAYRVGGGTGTYDDRFIKIDPVP